MDPKALQELKDEFGENLINRLNLKDEDYIDYYLHKLIYDSDRFDEAPQLFDMFSQETKTKPEILFIINRLAYDALDNKKKDYLMWFILIISEVDKLSLHQFVTELLKRVIKNKVNECQFEQDILDIASLLIFDEEKQMIVKNL